MKVYVAGPMTGYPEFNYPAFFDAARRLEAVGIEPINPARADGRDGCSSWLDYMRASLLDIAACDGIATLAGWQDSRGAALEVHIARSLDLPVRPVEAWLEDASVISTPPGTARFEAPRPSPCAVCGTGDQTCTRIYAAGGLGCCDACRATAGCSHGGPQGGGR